MPDEARQDRQSGFEDAIKDHDLEDLERILIVNDRRNMDPIFYNAVVKAITKKKSNPLVFVKYNRDFLLAMTALIVSIVALLED